MSIQQFIGVICGLIISYVFGHFTSKQLFGEYNLILSVFGFLTIITLPGVDNYLTRSIAQGYESSYVKAVKAKLLLSLLGLGILSIISKYYHLQGQEVLGSAFLVTALLFPLYHAPLLFNEFLTAKLQFKTLTIFLSLSSMITAVLTVIAILLKGSLSLIVGFYFLGTVVPGIVAFLYSFRFYKKSQKKEDKTLIKYGLFNTLLTIIPWSTGYIGQILIGTFLGPEQLAVFVVANKLPMYIQKNLFVFYKPVTAKLAHQSYKQHVETIKTHMVKFLGLGALLTLAIFITSPYVIKFIFTATYNDAIPVAQVLSLSVLPLPLSWVLGDIVIFQKIKKMRVYGSLFMNILKISLYVILIPIYKVQGLVMVILIERFLSPVINIFILNRLKNKSAEI